MANPRLGATPDINNDPAMGDAAPATLGKLPVKLLPPAKGNIVVLGIETTGTLPPSNKLPALGTIAPAARAGADPLKLNDPVRRLGADPRPIKEATPDSAVLATEGTIVRFVSEIFPIELICPVGTVTLEVNNTEGLSPVAINDATTELITRLVVSRSVPTFGVIVVLAIYAALRYVGRKILRCGTRMRLSGINIPLP